jgi:hypothetical protein
MDVDHDRSVKDGVDEYGHVDGLATAAGWGPAGPVEDTAIPIAKAHLEGEWVAIKVVCTRGRSQTHSVSLPRGTYRAASSRDVRL